MFTVIFAMSRTVGWISHWDEMLFSNLVTRSARPRQLYTGVKLHAITYQQTSVNTNLRLKKAAMRPFFVALHLSICAK